MTANPAAVMASPDYQAWAEAGEPAPAPKLSFAGELAARMSSDQLGAVRKVIIAGTAVYELTTGIGDFWSEQMELAHELHEAWEIAFERETGRKLGGYR